MQILLLLGVTLCLPSPLYAFSNQAHAHFSGKPHVLQVDSSDIRISRNAANSMTEAHVQPSFWSPPSGLTQHYEHPLQNANLYQVESSDVFVSRNVALAASHMQVALNDTDPLHPDGHDHVVSEGHMNGRFLTNAASRQIADFYSVMKMGWNDIAQGQMPVSLQLHDFEEPQLLERLYWLLGGSAVVFCLAILGEIFASWSFSENLCIKSVSACLENLWMLALLAAGNWSFMQAIIHFGHQILDIGIGPIFLSRGVFTVVLGLGLAKGGSTSVVLWPDDRQQQKLLVLGGLMNSASVLLLIAALMCAPSPVVNIMFCSRTFFSALGGYLICQETLTWQQWVCMTLGAAVISIMVYATADDQVIQHNGVTNSSLNMTLGVGFAIAAAALMAASLVTIRCLEGQVDLLAHLVSRGWTNIVLCIPLFIFYWEDFMRLVTSPSVAVALVLIGQGTTNFGAQMTTIKIAMLAKLGPIQTFMVGVGLVLQCAIDLFMGYRYQILAWVALALMLVWLPLSAFVDTYWSGDGKNDPPLSSVSSRSPLVSERRESKASNHGYEFEPVLTNRGELTWRSSSPDRKQSNAQPAA